MQRDQIKERWSYKHKRGEKFVLHGRLNVIGKINKDKVTALGINLTNNEVKYIIKVIRSLEKSRSILKGSTWKITGQKGGFLNLFRPLMTASLPLMKNVLTPLAKSILIP